MTSEKIIAPTAAQMARKNQKTIIGLQKELELLNVKVSKLLSYMRVRGWSV